MTQAVVNREHNRRALFGGQSHQRRLRLPGHFTFSRRNSRFGLPAGHLPGTAGVSTKTARLIPPPVQSRVNGDAAKPRRKFRAAVEGIDLPVGANERLLRQILGIGGRPCHSKCQRTNHVLMLAYQRFKSRRPAILTLQHQIFVGVSHAACF